MAEETKKLSTTKMEGTVYLSSYGTVYHKAKIDADRLKKYSKNVYGAGVANKHRHLIFNEKYSIEVTDKTGKPDEDLSLHLTQMMDSKEVRLWPKMQTAWNDVFWFGMSFFNPSLGICRQRVLPYEVKEAPSRIIRNGSLWQERDLFGDPPGRYPGSADWGTRILSDAGEPGRPGSRELVREAAPE